MVLKGIKKELLNLPNLLSLSRLVLSFIIPILWVVKVPERIIYGLILFGALSDTLDGNLARILNQKSSLGKILDPLADKCFINMLFFLFYLKEKIESSLFIVILTRDIGILLGVGYLIKKGIDFKYVNPTPLGKISTVFQLITLIALFTSNYIKPLPPQIMRTIIILTIFFTLASGFHYLLLFKKTLTFFKKSVKI